jgi:hypothetical protein
VPAALAAVVERAMAKDPAYRYPTAQALRRALDTVDLRIETRKRPTAAAMAVATEPIPARKTTDLAAMQKRPTAASTAVATEPIRGSPQRGGARRRRTLLVVGAVVAAAILVTAFALTQRRNGDNDTTTASSRTESSGVTTSVSPTTAQATAARPTTTASGTATPESATRSYYALLDGGRIDEGWSWLSPAYQQQTGRSSYEGFWRTIDGVEVLTARAEGLTAWATLRYTRTNGTASTENVRLDFVADATGRLLINGYQTGVSAP